MTPTGSTSSSHRTSLPNSTVTTTTTIAEVVGTNVHDTNTNTGSNHHHHHTIVTERYLLARTKDERYVDHCTNVILRILRLLLPQQQQPSSPPPPQRLQPLRWLLSWFRMNNNNNNASSTTGTGSTQQQQERYNILLIAEYMSWMLYLLIATKSSSTTTTTPGMDICQLEYRNHQNRSTSLSPPLSPPPPTTTMTMKSNTSSIPSIRLTLQQRLPSFVRHVMAVTPLVSMTTLWYSVRYWSWMIQQQQQQKSRRNNYNNNDYNHLTGQSRQEIYYLQRQEMIRRSNATTTTATTTTGNNNIINQDTMKPSSSSSSSSTVVAVTSPTISSPTKRPISNMAIPASDGNCDLTIDNNQQQQQQQHSRRRTVIFRRMYETFIVAIDTAIQSIPHTINGPHYTTTTTITDPSTSTTSRTTDTTSVTTTTRLIHVIQWIYQFYVAYYYINGHYPTFLHRLFQYRPTRQYDGSNNIPSSSSSSVTNSGTKIVPVVGKLLMIQLIWKLLLYGISEPAIDSLIKMKRKKYVLRVWRSIKELLGLHSDDKGDNKERYIYMTGIAPMNTTTSRTTTTNTMLINSANVQPSTTMGHNRTTDNTDPSTSTTITTNPFMCGICRNSGTTNVNTSSLSLRNNKNTNTAMLLYPSCSIQCGHVFCWYCIQQWLTYYDTKCPICRTICTTNDIQLLYNC